MIDPSLRPLGRREVLRLLSGTGLALLAGRPASAQTTSAIVGASNPLEPGSSSFSVLTPELTEGPFYIDLERMRRDITEGQPGVPLRLRIRLPKICHPEVAPAALRETGSVL
jgi:hypothetical protein